ncbi:MAG: hypothetical protein R3E53_20705 [Myxococcota bacterium]
MSTWPITRSSRFVDVVDALPSNASGKVLKHELRARVAARAGARSPRVDEELPGPGRVETVPAVPAFNPPRGASPRSGRSLGERAAQGEQDRGPGLGDHGDPARPIRTD